MPDASANPFRNLPAVNDLLQAPQLAGLSGRYAHNAIVDAIRAELADLRARLAQGHTLNGCTPASIAESVEARLHRTHRALLRSVINATGIVLHTNLGRAIIAEEAARAAYQAARGYLNLELDLDTGKRSSRQNPIRAWLCRLTDAESATVVNNNAAATV
ncbi:MAG TPA: hypothetical protein VFE62_09385, partial [Gemmataceae bacterium]|nr:hypothetical protein [Gemmataceae bacterium]